MLEIHRVAQFTGPVHLNLAASLSGSFSDCRFQKQAANPTAAHLLTDNEFLDTGVYSAAANCHRIRQSNNPDYLVILFGNQDSTLFIIINYLMKRTSTTLPSVKPLGWCLPRCKLSEKVEYLAFIFNYRPANLNHFQSSLCQFSASLKILGHSSSSCKCQITPSYPTQNHRQTACYTGTE